MLAFALKRVKQKKQELKQKGEKENENKAANSKADNQAATAIKSEFKLDPIILEELGAKAKKYYPSLKQPIIEKILKNIEMTLNPIYSQYLTVCKTINNGNVEIDVAILRALLKAKSEAIINENSIQSQLRLALKWNRIDMAKNFIMTEKNLVKAGSLENLMFSAIKDDRFEFVDLFLRSGFSLKSFLTYRVLLKLYNEVSFL